MIFEIIFSDKANEDNKKLKKSEPQSYKKLAKLTRELSEHPYIGTGHPEPLRGDKSGLWSRRITNKHRLIYEVDEQQIIVIIHSTYGHYNDK
ncbi:MAG: Txe/YoeB family addiction module toxin [Flavobacteriaceae bacterium]|jgi:toxin YoeB|nr:Txe/YoeB family addiction module toxin [Flavobacteriaceae bacterium]